MYDDDHTPISNLYLGGPSQLRDASQPSPSPWKTKPTKIITPTGSRTHSGKGSNPFGGARFNDPLRNGRGNLAAQQTLTGYANNRSSGPPPNKKPRVDNSVSRSRKKVPQPSNSASRPRRLGDPDDTDIIIVDDEYEGLGQRLVESDDLTITHSTRRNSHPIADGPATTLIRLAPEDARRQDSDDPMESYEHSEISANRKPKNIKKKVQDYEKLKPELIDFLTILDKPTNVKRIMKPRRGNVNHEKLKPEPLQCFDFSTISDKPTNVKRIMKRKNPTAAPPILMNSQRPKPNPTSTPSAKRNLLPIKAWYLGRKFFEEPYHLMWTHSTKLIIRSGDDPDAKAKHSEEIDISMVTKRIYFVDPSEQYPNKVFVLETLQKSNAGTQKPFGTLFSDYFKQSGNRAEGEILIQFDSGSPAWADTVYGRFIQWLQGNVDQRQKIRGKAGDAKWEAASRMAQIEKALESRIRREADGVSASAVPKAAPAKSPAVPRIPPLDDWSPPPAITNTASAASRPEHQGSPGSPRMSQITNAAEARIREADGVSASAIPKAATAKSPAVPGIPPLDDWSPPPAITNTARAASRPERQGSPGSPIEVGSPTRAPQPYPGPRSINRHADPDTAGGGHEVRRSARQSVAPQQPQLDPDEVARAYSTQSRVPAALSIAVSAPPAEQLPTLWRGILGDVAVAGYVIPPATVMQKFGEKREECLRDFRNAQAFLQKAVLMNDEFAQTSGTGVVPASVSTYVKLPPPQVIEGALGIELDPAVVTAKEVAEKEICNATLKYLSVFYGAQLTSIRELLKIPTASEAFASSLKEYSARIISDAGGADTAIWNPVIERIKAALVTELESLNYEYMATLIRDAQAKEVKANAV